MFVVKRDGVKAAVDISKIQRKLEDVSKKIYPLTKIDLNKIVQLVQEGLYQNITTTDIDKYTSKKCIELSLVEPEYGVLASRLLVDNHHRNTLSSFKDKMRILYRRHDKQGKTHPLISAVFYKFVEMHQKALERMIDYDRDYLLDVFGFMTLENQYINKVDGQMVERPQDLFMREAITVCMDPTNFKNEQVIENIHLIYDLLSCRAFTYATPTLNNSGFRNQQLSSCFLLSITDSLEGINKGLVDASKISKMGGGVGINFSSIRPQGSLIRGTNGYSKGVREFVRSYGQASTAWDQGGTRAGSFALFLRDFHPDFIQFIGMKNPRLHESLGDRRIFYAAALSDMFWTAVENDSEWHFISPEESPGLENLVGEKFEQEIDRLVKEKKYQSKMPAREVLKEIMRNQFISGVPYIINIDQINRKNNLSHYSNVLSSNLCVEITLPSSEFEYAVCNLCSIVLPTFVHQKGDNFGDLQTYRSPKYLPTKITDPVFDFNGLAQVVEKVAETMDRVIDRNNYPVLEAVISNFLHRPIGIGSSGFANVCCLMKTPYNSEQAVKLTSYIAETIAYGSLTASTKLAKKLATPKQEEKSRKMFELFEERKKILREKQNLEASIRSPDRPVEGKTSLRDPDLIVKEMLDLAREIGPYPSYFYGEGAPISRGQFQWKMWGLTEHDLSGFWDWGTLEQHIRRYGVRNSLLTAQMPTATTAQIMGVNESVEPFTANIYRRKVLTGEYEVINKHLISDLTELGMWDENMKNFLVGGGSIQDLALPPLYKELYRTAWEMPQKISIQHAAARGPFLDHSQSFNVWIPNKPIGNIERADLLYRVLIEGWKSGLKTGIYYLRTEPAGEAQKFTVPLDVLNKIQKTDIPLTRKIEIKFEVPGEMGCLVCGT